MAQNKQSPKQGYRDLLVWQKAYGLCLMVYKATKSYPKEELYGLTSQTRRSAISAPANIAEGYGRQGKQEFIQYLHIARGSLYELETHLFLGRDLKYLSIEEHLRLELTRQEVTRLLRGLLRSLKS